MRSKGQLSLIKRNLALSAEIRELNVRVKRQLRLLTEVREERAHLTTDLENRDKRIEGLISGAITSTRVVERLQTEIKRVELHNRLLCDLKLRDFAFMADEIHRLSQPVIHAQNECAEKKG